MDIGALITKMKENILLIPEERFDALTKDSGYGDSFIYLLAAVLITLPIYIALQVLGFGMNALTSSTGAGLAELPILGGVYAVSIAIGIVVRLLSVPLSYIGFGIVHILLKLVGGKADFLKTVQLMIYGSTPSLLLSWIPCVGWIFGLAGLVNIILGAKRVHNITLLRAIVAIIVIPVLVAVVVAVLVVLFFGFILAGMGLTLPRI
ncbi:MAG: YIP1 family protein [Candidatus ainarchaeum sp.]|nr:YIP1 family protein [Candidatus ainarchaeum sp.]